MKDTMDHDISVLTSRLEEEVAWLSSSASSEVWYIDSGASAHMMGFLELPRRIDELQNHHGK